jgi:hypothetical protein
MARGKQNHLTSSDGVFVSREPIVGQGAIMIGAKRGPIALLVTIRGSGARG